MALTTAVRLHQHKITQILNKCQIYLFSGNVLIAKFPVCYWQFIIVGHQIVLFHGKLCDSSESYKRKTYWTKNSDIMQYWQDRKTVSIRNHDHEFNILWPLKSNFSTSASQCSYCYLRRVSVFKEIFLQDHVYELYENIKASSKTEYLLDIALIAGWQRYWNQTQD